MTVGIYLCHNRELEALVISDIRGSRGSRQTDSLAKTGVIERDDYWGVVCYSGSSRLGDRILTSLDSFTGDSLDDYARAILKAHRKNMAEIEQDYLDLGEVALLQAAGLYRPEKVRADSATTAEALDLEDQAPFVQGRFNAALDAYDKWNNQQKAAILEGLEQLRREYSTVFLLTGYDKAIQRIQTLVIEMNGINRIEQTHAEIGSGTDGSQMYLDFALQGISQKWVLPRADLVLYGFNAFHWSTINQGVGGTPVAYFVSPAGVTELEVHQINAILRVSGAFLTESPASLGMHHNATQQVATILEDDPRGYKEIAQILGCTEDDLRKDTLSMSQMQITANRARYSGNPKVKKNSAS